MGGEGRAGQAGERGGGGGPSALVAPSKQGGAPPPSPTHPPTHPPTHLHEPARRVRANGDGGEVKGPQALPDLWEYWAVAGVPAKPKAPLRSQHRPAAPER